MQSNFSCIEKSLISPLTKFSGCALVLTSKNMFLVLRVRQANGRNDHVTMFTIYLPLAVFGFSIKLSSFASSSKARIILHYSHLGTNLTIKYNFTTLYHEKTGRGYPLVTTYQGDEGRNVFPSHSEPQVRPFPSHGFNIITESVNSFIERREKKNI